MPNPGQPLPRSPHLHRQAQPVRPFQQQPLRVVQQLLALRLCPRLQATGDGRGVARPAAELPGAAALCSLQCKQQQRGIGAIF